MNRTCTWHIFICVETSLVQNIDSPNHKSGNILDLAFFSQEHKWSYTVLERNMSDHYPIILNTDVVMTLENHETQFSFGQFNYSLFKELIVMNRALAELCHSQNPSFLFQWFQLLDHAMQLSLPRKRQKRLQLIDPISNYQLLRIKNPITQSQLVVNFIQKPISFKGAEFQTQLSNFDWHYNRIHRNRILPIFIHLFVTLASANALHHFSFNFLSCFIFFRKANILA